MVFCILEPGVETLAVFVICVSFGFGCVVVLRIAQCVQARNSACQISQDSQDSQESIKPEEKKTKTNNQLLKKKKNKLK